jgi:hypothetical protein
MQTFTRNVAIELELYQLSSKIIVYSNFLICGLTQVLVTESGRVKRGSSIIHSAQVLCSLRSPVNGWDRQKRKVAKFGRACSEFG